MNLIGIFEELPTYQHFTDKKEKKKIISDEMTDSTVEQLQMPI